MVLLSAGSASAAPISYLISVDTTSVSGTSGYLEFQFNPGASNVQGAVATVSDFNAGGGTLGPSVIEGSVVGGPLPAPLTFTNSTPLNDFLQPFQYGSFFSFVLSLSGPALLTPDGTAAGTTFGLSLLDFNQEAILTNQGTPGFAASVVVNSDGLTTVTAFPTLTGPSVVTFDPAPEPGSMVLLTFGAAGLVLLRKFCAGTGR